MSCECIRIEFALVGEKQSTTIELFIAGTYNGENYYTWNYLGVDYFLYYNNSGGGQWQVTIGGIGDGFPIATAWKDSLPPCPPLGSMPVWIPGGTFDVFTTMECLPEPPIEDSCDCGIDVYVQYEKEFYSFQVDATGTFNGKNVYQWNGNIGNGDESLGIYWDFTNWRFEGSITGLIAILDYNSNCPFGNVEDWIPNIDNFRINTTATECIGCKKIEDRIFREYGAIKLPEIFEEENRGFFRCCCPFNVLASPSSDSWKNDITSAWIKLSDPSDTATCYLLKDGVQTQYLTTIIPFINEQNAFYWTINWNDVLSLDGAGCYSIKINYNISGVQQEFTWGIYHLKPFSIQNALTTARLRVFLNSHQEIEGINFTGSNVEDSIRFYGFIGNRQPKTEIDNLIYQNREMQKVIRENLNVYEVITDPTCEDHIKKLTDLYLLSENEMYISDYNAHNHSYRYNDLPVILEETAEITYFEYSREASLKCTVSDKFKNQRSFY